MESNQKAVLKSLKTKEKFIIGTKLDTYVPTYFDSILLSRTQHRDRQQNKTKNCSEPRRPKTNFQCVKMLKLYRYVNYVYLILACVLSNIPKWVEGELLLQTTSWVS